MKPPYIPSRQQLNKVVLKLHRVVMDMSPSALAHDEHLSQVAFGLHVALEAIFVPALLLTDLAVPSKPLKPLGLHGVGEVFRGPDFCALSLSKVRSSVLGLSK